MFSIWQRSEISEKKFSEYGWEKLLIFEEKIVIFFPYANA